MMHGAFARTKNLLKKLQLRRIWTSFMGASRNILIWIKHLIFWFAVNFVLSLIPIFATLMVDYKANQDVLNYSDAVFLGILSFSFTLLVTCYYTREIWVEEMRLIKILSFISIIVISIIYTYYYSYAGPAATETIVMQNAMQNAQAKILGIPSPEQSVFPKGSFAELISTHKFIIVNWLVILTLLLGVFLTLPSITKAAIEEQRKRMEKVTENAKASYSKFNAEL